MFYSWDRFTYQTDYPTLTIRGTVRYLMKMKRTKVPTYFIKKLKGDEGDPKV
jgi:hypothetical protein